MALSVIAVSISVSPLRIEDELTAMFMTSAPRRFAGKLEGRLGAGRDLEEQIDLGAAAQRRTLLFDLTVEFDEFLGEIEEAHDLVMGQSFDPQQVPMMENERRFRRDVH